MGSMRKRRPMLVAVAGMGALALALAACSAFLSGTSASRATLSFDFVGTTGNTAIPTTLKTLSRNECRAENDAQPLRITTQAPATLARRLLHLADQRKLPHAFITPRSLAVTSQLATQGRVQDVGAALEQLGLSNAIVPAARSTIGALYDGEDVVLPTEFHIEGIWYNKTLLAAHGVAVPTTWDELVAAFAKLKAAGVQPVAQAGKGGDGWGVTRWVGDYIARDLGPDAMKAVKDGTAKLTDPQYVRAAETIATLGKQGYFGTSPTSVDYATALSTFLSGKAAFTYLGSWAVADFDNPAENKIGAKAIGFMPFPTVAGGQGSADQMPTDLGTSVALSARGFTHHPTSQNWVRCIVENYGTVALRDSGQITGFRTAGTAKVSDLTALVQHQIAGISTSILWFEAYFDAKATATSQDDGGLLASGTLTGAEFMTQVQADLGS